MTAVLSKQQVWEYVLALTELLVTWCFKCKLRTLIQTLVKKATAYTSNPQLSASAGQKQHTKEKKLAHGILQPSKNLMQWSSISALFCPLFSSVNKLKMKLLPQICRNVLRVLATQSGSIRMSSGLNYQHKFARNCLHKSRKFNHNPSSSKSL